MYSNLQKPIGSGVTDVQISVDGANCHYTATTAGMMGLWQIADVTPGTYSVTATKLGCTFEQVVAGVPGNPPPIEISVGRCSGDPIVGVLAPSPRPVKQWKVDGPRVHETRKISIDPTITTTRTEAEKGRLSGWSGRR